MRINDWLIPVIAGVIFIIISSWYISLPGLQYDESLSAAPAVNFLIKNSQTEPMQINPSVIKIFGRPLPIMIMTYIGPVKTLLHIPIFWIFDISVITVRLLPIIFVFLCYLLTYQILLNLFNKELAIIVIALMSIDPSIIFYLTRDVGPAALQVFFKLLALVFFIRWWNVNRDIFLHLGSFILGLGVSHKVDFLWVTIGIVFSFGLVYFKDLSSRLSFKKILISIISCCIGAIPVVLFNIVTGGYTFNLLISKFINSQTVGSIPIVDNFLTRINQLIDIHNGNFISFLFCEKEVYSNILKYFYPLILIVSLLNIIISLIRSEKPNNFLNALALLLFVVIVIFETCFSPTELSGHHLLAVTPFITVIIVYGILTIKFLKKSIKYIILTCLFIYLFLSSITINNFLKDTGGIGSWSNRIYDLNNYLLIENKEIYALDWGFTNNLIVLSKGQLKINRLYTIKWDDKDRIEKLKDAMNENALYLAHSEKYTNFHEIRSKFVDVARELNFNIKKNKSFFLKNGEIIYIVYSLERN